ncbi:MAG: hypothetical protein A2047_00400 [Omnitrophica bacterium GWA2_41_15]|nr:MAG: hypothetical protein A2047_00400 [Omnitrophica bacterium GWA2_41_15]HAZ10986.1 hypothetical protein [Candidatus Omnitrophota bacterium]
MRETSPSVNIVVVNYNGKQYLKDCLSSLLRLNYPENKIKILMVDNCSDDGSVDFVKDNFQSVKIIQNDINNYARANNLGLKESRGEYIAFINNDIEVDKDWLIELLKVMDKEERAGAAGGKILLKDGKIQSTGHEEYPNFYWGDRGFRQQDKDQYGKIEEVISLCGAAILFRKTCLDEIGVFDEDFVMYLEDIDMCFRAAKKKWKILYVPKSIVKHYFRGTSDFESVRYFSERNRLLLIAKHFSEQLGKSLYGKGYFTVGEHSIYDLLPLIFSKLLACHGLNMVKAILPDIFKNFKNIAALENCILMDRIEESENIISQKQAFAEDLNRANSKLNDHVQKLSRDIESKDSILREKESVLSQKDIMLQKTREELIDSKNNLERIIRFDKKIKILLVKPQQISIQDVEEVARIIKKKYPNSSIYLFANLLKEDYKRLSKNNDIEKDLIYYLNGSKLFVRIPGLFSKLLSKRFDMAVALLAHKNIKGYTGYKKTKLITILSNSKNKHSYYVD